MSSLIRRIKGKDTLAWLCLTISVALYVFWDFVLLRKAYLFKDIGSDSINGVLPQLVHLVDYLHTNGLPRWSFNQGMGQNLFPMSIGDPFVLVFYAIGRNNLAYGFAFVEILKVILGGLFFFLCLRTVNLSRYTAVVGGLLYSFSGFMIVGGGWYVFSSEATWAALLLLSFEKLLKQGQWYWLPIPIVLFASYQPFNLYLYGVLLAGYASIRFAGERDWDLPRAASFFAKLAGLVVLGMGLSALFLIPNIDLVLESPRVSGAGSRMHLLSSQPMFQLAEPIQYMSVLLRTFSSDLLGTGNAFRGWMNYLESPMSYCGTISVLLAPQFLIFLDRKRAIAFSILTAVFSAALVFPYFRHLFWLFSGDYFRALSFFMALGLLGMGLSALSDLDTKAQLGVKSLVASLLVAILLLYLPWSDTTHVVNASLRFTVTCFLTGYTVLLLLMRSKVYKPYAKAGILLGICVELAYFSSFAVNARDLVTSDELNRRVGYNDYTIEAVEYLSSIDDGFFRVIKDYSSGLARHPSINDGKVQGYYGTTSYSSFNQKYYIEFLQAVDIIEKGNEIQTRWATGLGNRPQLLSWGSVKYGLSKNSDDHFARMGFEQINALHDVRVFKNPFFLPLGFCYDRYLPSSAFSKLASAQKQRALLEAFVVDDARVGDYAAFERLDDSTLYGSYTFAEYAADIGNRRRDCLEMHRHGQNHIEGSITVDRKRLLFFSIPYDRGWSAKVDGNEADLKLVNVGFMGITMEEGTHVVELNFAPPYLLEGGMISVAAVLVYAILLFRTRRSATSTDIAPPRFNNPSRRSRSL